MKKAFQLFAICVLVSAAPVVTKSQVQIRGGGIPSALSVQRYSTGYATYGSIGQIATHAFAINDTAEMQLGIWSQARMASVSNENTKVTLPRVSVKSGDTLSFDVPFEAPCQFFITAAKRRWSLQLSFNRSVIEPLDYTSIVDDGQRYFVTFSGSTDESSGSLARIRVVTRLGNDTATDLKVEDFKWTDIPRQTWTGEDGRVSFTGLCITNGSTRLILERSKPAVFVAPNPSYGSQITVRPYSPTSEVGVLRILDLQGTVLREIADVPAASDMPMVHMPMDFLPAGTYVMQLIVPSGSTSTIFVRMP